MYRQGVAITGSTLTTRTGKGATVDADTPPEAKLDFAISTVGNVLFPVLGDLPSDSRVRSVLLNLSEAIHQLAVAHIARLRDERGWKKQAKAAWRTAASAERLVVLHHDTSPFDGLGAVDVRGIRRRCIAQRLRSAAGGEASIGRGVGEARRAEA